ncbi:MAG: kaiC 2 [Betaproteobacteria bacterium]|jgi:circadian clock protein KaiC|nr:kaiC 2 [Betaproteobacteria bacterium]MEA3152426.1 circadian clock protein KaiC [Betaproteobacteria bacterium]
MSKTQEQSQTGVPGLDEILYGGLPAGRLYLVDGNPGVGKTTLALQFLLEGVRRGERCLYVTLSETKAELDSVADSHGWTLEGISIIELSQIESALTTRSQNTLFQPAEVELNNLSKLLLEQISELKPSRLVLDSLSEMRLLAQNPLRYRRQILTFKQRFSAIDCTVLLLDDRSAVGPDVQVQSIVHGMLTLSIIPLKFGINRRYLSVTKLRGARFREGNHDYVINRGGITLYPRLVAADYPATFTRTTALSGNSELDKLIGGGLDAGTSNLLMGPAGSGKSTVASLFVHAAAERGDKAMLFAFDESLHTLYQRTRDLGLDLQGHVESGRLTVQQVDPAEIAPGELSNKIVECVEKLGVRMIVLDSLNGYVNAMPQEDFLSLHLHELLSFLNQRGVVTIMVLAQQGLIGAMGTPVDVSYLADTVILTRFFEARGEVRKAISIIKKRSGAHETAIREMLMSRSGIQIGRPLSDFEGVLTGVPRFVGANTQIMGGDPLTRA